MEEGSVVGGTCKRVVREDEKEQLGLEFGSLYGHSQKLIRTDLALLSSYGHSRGGVLRYPMFTLEQREELKRQALIYKYLVSSAPIPAYLLYDRVVPNIPPLYPYLGRGVGCGYLNVLKFAGNADPEPGRCRRTDGKKWRCSRDVAAPDQRYCERHMHRGRPRSRKPVEQPIQKITNSPSSKPLEPTVMQPVKEPTRYWDWRKGASNDIQTNDFDHQQKQNSDLNDPCDSFLNPDISSLEDPSRPPRSFIDAWSSEISNKTSSITSVGNLSPSTLTLSMCAEEDENQTQMGLGFGDLSRSHPPSWMNMSDPLGGPLAEVLQSGTTVSSPQNSSGHAEAASMGSRGGFMNMMGINFSGSDTLVSPRDSPTGVLQRSIVSVSDSSGNSSPTFGMRSDLGLQWMRQHNK